jgi:predicted ABC-type sugar transport system permease subunit
VSPLERPAPPIGEDIHLPGPTVIPMLLAFSVALALVGVTTFWWLIPIGGVIALACLVRWIRDTRHEIDRLPPEH